MFIPSLACRGSLRPAHPLPAITVLIRYTARVIVCTSSLVGVTAFGQSVDRSLGERLMNWWEGASSTAPHPAVARISVPETEGTAYGSGTLVDVSDTAGLVVTNWHVVAQRAGEIRVRFPDGFESPAQVLRTDRDWDLAALAIRKPSIAPVRVSALAPRPGETLTIAGYGSGNYRSVSGRCTQYVAPGMNQPYEMVELLARARQGDSGGPILNTRGELAGVLFGEGGGHTAGSYCGRVHQFLVSLRDDAPRVSPLIVNASSDKPKEGQPAALANVVRPEPGVSSFVAVEEQPSVNTSATNASVPETTPRAMTLTTTKNTYAAAVPTATQPLAQPSFATAASVTHSTGHHEPPWHQARSNTFASNSAPPQLASAPAAMTRPSTRFANSNRPQTIAPAHSPDSAWDEFSWWQRVLGETQTQRIKTILAGIGVLLLALHTHRWIQGGDEPAKPIAYDDLGLRRKHANW